LVWLPAATELVNICILFLNTTGGQNPEASS